MFHKMVNKATGTTEISAVMASYLGEVVQSIEAEGVSVLRRQIDAVKDDLRKRGLIDLIEYLEDAIDVYNKEFVEEKNARIRFANQLSIELSAYKRGEAFIGAFDKVFPGALISAGSHFDTIEDAMAEFDSEYKRLTAK